MLKQGVNRTFVHEMLQIITTHQAQWRPAASTVQSNHASSLFCQWKYDIVVMYDCVILTVCFCVVVWNWRCSSRTSASPNRSEADTQPGTQLCFIPSFLFILPARALLHHPLCCSTDRRCVLILPLRRPEVLGELTVIRSLLFHTHITSL